MVDPNTILNSSQASAFTYAGAGPSSEEDGSELESESDTVTKGGDNKDDDDDFVVDTRRRRRRRRMESINPN